MYYVLVNIKTPQGMLEIGKYFLGPEESFATQTFFELRGSENIQLSPCIRLDLIHEPAETLPVCIKSVGCSLQEYTQNCGILTREIFRHFMFQDKSPYMA